MNKILKILVVAALVLCGVAVYTVMAMAADDAIVITAEDIVSGELIVSSINDASYGKLFGGNVKGEYVDGVIRFTTTNPGSASATSDRFIISVGSVNLTEYPYMVISYRTNVAAPDLNFNLTTDKGEYTREAKMFNVQERVVGDFALGVGTYKGGFGANAVATSVYVPVWSNTSSVMNANDYFDVQYIGFFKSEEAAKAYKYTPGEIKVKVELREKVQRLVVGETFKLNIMSAYKSLDGVTFESDNEAVATVSADGTITAKSAGIANISANGDSCKVYVLAEKLAPVEFARRSGMKTVETVVNCLGDSITTYAPGPDGGKNYHDWWAQDYYVKNIDSGISGTTVLPRANRTDSFIERYPNMAADADLVVVMGGTNDWGGTPQGTINDRGLKTYMGGIRLLMEGLIDKYPNSQIVFLTPIKRCEGGQTPEDTNGYGNTLNDYANAVIELGKIYGIPVIDTYTPEELDFTSTRISPAGKDANGKWHDAVCESDLMPDGLHPSGKGHKIIASYTLEKLVELGVVEITDGFRTDEAFMTGYEGNLFKPDNSMTRAEACAVVARLLTTEEKIKDKFTSKYPDVEKGAWYYDYVAYLEQYGYIYSFKGDFKPDQPITRAEFLELVYKMGKLKKTDKAVSFTDVPETHERYEVIVAAVSAGLANGKTETTFDPDGVIKRSEAVKMLCTALGRTPDKDVVVEANPEGFADVSESHWAYTYIMEATVNHKATLNEDGKLIWKSVIK